MVIRIKKGAAKGTVQAPPAKSFVHRQLICAALSDGQSIVRNICESGDIEATIDCACSLGAKIDVANDTAYITPSGELKDELYCRESGSTMRFFIPLCLSYGRQFTLYGEPRLLQRPLDVYRDICNSQNLYFEQTDGYVKVNGKLDLSDITVKGSVSSQFITGLLLAAPLYGKDSIIRITPPFVSRPYVDITLSVMADFGIAAEWKDEYTLYIKGGQKYRSSDCIAEGDWSGAAFMYGLDALGADVVVTGLNENSLQGDRVILKQYEALKKGHTDIDITNCPDNAPALMAVAAALNGCTLRGAARLRLKESDRGAAMAQELSKFGVKVTVNEDTIEVGHGIKKPHETINGHNDHRIVMAAALLLTLTGGKIDGAEAVAKSYPKFFYDLGSLGIKTKQV